MPPFVKALIGGVLFALVFAAFDSKPREIPMHLLRIVLFAGWIFFIMRHLQRRKPGRNEVVLCPPDSYNAPAIASIHDPRKAANAVHVVAGVARRDGTIMIARRAPHKPLPEKWEFPGGKVEAGEEPVAALARELHEEFGVPVQVGDRIGERVHEYPGQTIWLEAYYVTLGEGEIQLESHDQVEWVSPAELRRFDLADADWFIVEYLDSIAGQ